MWRFTHARSRTRALSLDVAPHPTPPATARFFHGELPIMLYTGRMWFFNRTKIRGVKRVHFFSPPEYTDEYAEIASWVEGGGGGGGGGGVATTFTKFEGAAMEKVVGVKGWKHLRESEKGTFVFA